MSVPNVTANYQTLYQTVPVPQNASPQTRDLIDMSDAAAQAAMKRAIAIDAIADAEMQAADRINTELGQAAPGTAPMIEAEAAAWLVRANAYTQSALGDVMRLRAVTLANSGAQLKFNASGARPDPAERTGFLEVRCTMFYFQTMFQQVYNGITGSAVLTGRATNRRGDPSAGRALCSVRGVRQRRRRSNSSAGRRPLPHHGACSSVSIRTSSGMSITHSPILPRRSRRRTYGRTSATRSKATSRRTLVKEPGGIG